MTRQFGIGWTPIVEPSSSVQGSGPPLTHPRAMGLESVVQQAVKDEFARQSGDGGNGGGIEKRLAAVENRIKLIEETMVTKEVLQKELRTLQVEISKVPFETIKWVFGLPGILA